MRFVRLVDAAREIADSGQVPEDGVRLGPQPGRGYERFLAGLYSRKGRGVIRTAYNLALAGAGMLAASPWLAARLARGRYRDIALARLGLGGLAAGRFGRRGCIWLHALSVGEAGSALPLLKPPWAERFPKPAPGLVRGHGPGPGRGCRKPGPSRADPLFSCGPLDCPGSVYRLLDRLQPSLFCLVEGDIWPFGSGP